MRDCSRGLGLLAIAALMLLPGCGDDADGQSGPAQACTASGGTVAMALCCESTADFPNSCSIGACGCPPAGSHQVQVCDCGEGQCFDGSSCVSR